MAIRLLLADHQPLLRAGLRLILGSQPGIEIVAECSDDETAVAAARRHRPDVILMDVRMPGLDGLAATRLILDHPLAPPVLMLTTVDDDEVLWGAIRSGAMGIVLEDSEPDDLVRAVCTIARGAVFAKLGVRDRAGAIVVAFESGLGRGPIAATSRAS